MENNVVSINKENSFELLTKYRGAIMGYATLLIFIFHECHTIITNGILHDVEAFLIGSSYYGVDIFLLVSGMGLYYSMENDPSVLNFYKKRAIRIIPAYFLAGIVCFFLRNWTLSDFVKHLSGYSYFAINVDSFLWFATYILIIYLFFPLFYKLLKRTKNELVTIGIVFVVYEVIFFILSPYIRADLSSQIGRIAIVLFGVLIANLIKTHTYKFKWYVWVLLVLIFIAGISLEYFKQNYQVILIPRISAMLPQFMMAVSTSFILAGLLSSLKNVGEILNKGLSFLGKFSFEFYLVQEILGIRVLYWVGNVPFVIRNIMVFVILGLIALIVRIVFDCLIKVIKKYG